MNNPGGSFDVSANNAVIDGFTITGGTTAPLATGMYLRPTASGYQVLNNIFRDNTFGLYLNSQGTTQTLVRHNLFDSNDEPARQRQRDLRRQGRRYTSPRKRFTATPRRHVFAGRRALIATSR